MADQRPVTVTIKVNYLPEVVEFLYYQQGGWLSVLFGNDERQLCGNYAVYYVMSMEQGEVLAYRTRGSRPEQAGVPVRHAPRACRRLGRARSA